MSKGCQWGLSERTRTKAKEKGDKKAKERKREKRRKKRVRADPGSTTWGPETGWNRGVDGAVPERERENRTRDRAVWDLCREASQDE
ncbi:hypothetical protein ACROYT_G040537 [Oculina patagonica]